MCRSGWKANGSKNPGVRTRWTQEACCLRLQKKMQPTSGDASVSQNRERGAHKANSPHWTRGQFISPLPPQEREEGSMGEKEP